MIVLNMNYVALLIDQNYDVVYEMMMVVDDALIVLPIDNVVENDQFDRLDLVVDVDQDHNHHHKSFVRLMYALNDQLLILILMILVDDDVLIDHDIMMIMVFVMVFD